MPANCLNCSWFSFKFGCCRYFFRNRIRYFFDTNFFETIQILFLIPNFFETDIDTFFDTKKFRNRYRYYQKKLKSFETEKFRNRNVTLCPFRILMLPSPLLNIIIVSAIKWNQQHKRFGQLWKFAKWPLAHCTIGGFFIISHPCHHHTYNHPHLKNQVQK